MPLSNREFAQNAIAFADDIEFHTNDKNFIAKMQKVIDNYTKQHEVIGGKI